MFEVLVESAARPPRSLGARAMALSVHGLVLCAAGLATRTEPAVPRKPVAVPIEIYAPGPREGRVGGAARGGGPVVEGPPAVPDIPTVPPVGIPEAEVSFGAADSLPSAQALAARAVGRLGLGETPGETVRLAGEVDEPVTVLKAQPPGYPSGLKAAGVSGVVQLEFVVDTAGRCEPRSVRVVSSSDVGFEGAAVAAVVGTVYRPARVKGQAVRQLVRQKVAFRME